MEVPFAKIVNDFYKLTSSEKIFHRRCSTEF